MPNDITPEPSLKKCSCCQQVLPLAQFTMHRGRKDGRDDYCRACKAAKNGAAIHRQCSACKREFPQPRHASVCSKCRKQSRSAKMKEAALALKSKGCADCGLKDVRCMEFHHPIPRLGDKKKLVGNQMGNMSMGYFRKQLDETVVLCANCHRIREWEKRNQATG